MAEITKSVGREVASTESDSQIFLSEEKAEAILNSVRAIVESEEKNRLLMDNSALGIGFYSTAGEIISINKEALRILGGKASDYLGQNVINIFGSDAGRTFIKRFETAANSEFSLQFEDYFKWGQNEDWYINTYTRILNNEGQINGIQVISDNISERKTAQLRLLESQKTLRSFAEHQNKLIENERSEIAFNLQEDLGQKLAALNMDIVWVKNKIGIQPKNIIDKFDEMSRSLSGAVEDINKITEFLKPLFLFDLGLIPAFTSLIRKFEKSTGIKCHFEFDQEEYDIDKRISLVLYRILQAALANISKHSGGNEAWTELQIVRNKMVLFIRDNGIGIDKNAVISAKSMGITGMREKVNSVSGKLKINGLKNKGTTIKVTVPLKRNIENDQHSDN